MKRGSRAKPAVPAALAFAPDAPLAYATQTTLSVDDTREIVAALTAEAERRARVQAAALTNWTNFIGSELPILMLL